MKANDYQVGGAHYRSKKIQHWDYVHANNIPYMEAQIIKYVERHELKGGVEDLKKAMHFLQKLIEQKYDLALQIPDVRGTIQGGGVVPPENHIRGNRDGRGTEGREEQEEGQQAEGYFGGDQR